MAANKTSTTRRMAVVIGWLTGQLERRRNRFALLELTDDQLKDIGLSRGEAYGFVERPVIDLERRAAEADAGFSRAGIDEKLYSAGTGAGIP